MTDSLRLPPQEFYDPRREPDTTFLGGIDRVAPPTPIR